MDNAHAHHAFDRQILTTTDARRSLAIQQPRPEPGQLQHSGLCAGVRPVNDVVQMKQCPTDY